MADLPLQAESASAITFDKISHELGCLAELIRMSAHHVTDGPALDGFEFIAIAVDRLALEVIGGAA